MNKIVSTLTILTLANQCFALDVPKNINWKMMPEIQLNTGTKSSNKDDQNIIKSIWKKDLNPSEAAYALLAKVNTPGNNYYLSMLNYVPEDKNYHITCIPPGNGLGNASAVDEYSICNMRVVQQNKVSNKLTVKNIPNFCYLNLDDTPQELKKYHTEYAYSSSNKTVYLRTIMYGKHVSKCDRAIPLQ